MKTHTIKTPTAELRIVEMPEGAKIRYYTLKDNDFDGIGILQHHQKPYIITGSYTLLGKPDEIKEEDSVGLVKMGSYMNTFWNYKTNDNHKSNQLRTAKESLLSLIESEIYWENPIELEKWDNDFGMSGNVITYEWKVAEQKTFDKNRSLIFKKVTPKI